MTTGWRGACVHEVFAYQAGRCPGAVAVVDGSGPLTYEELNGRAETLADRLTAAGVRGGDLVGVCLERGARMVVALLAVLKAGGGYVVLDPALPEARLRAMAADAGLGTIVSGSEGSGSKASGSEASGSTASFAPGVRQVPVQAPEASPAARRPRVHPDGIACAMFTSGSTGRPKGIAAPHGAVVDTLVGQDFAGFGPGEVWLQCAPVSWDAFALELWGPLLNGGTCVLHPPGRPEPLVMQRLIREHGVTHAYLSSSLFNVVVDEYPAALDGLRQVIVGGEALSPVHVGRALRRRPALRLRNGYGPVEGMVFLTTYPVSLVDAAQEAVPVGWTLKDKEVLVLDERLRPVPPGGTGELYAAGAGLALGYLGQPGVTAERFVPNPYGPPGSRMYRTGDRGRRRADGALEFLGRVDTQVKIRGFRVEPGEVQAVLARCPGVEQVAVVAGPDPRGDGQRLVAYVVAREEVRLREYAASVLPDFMVPSLFVPLAALPLTPNGKLDRAALPEPSAGPGPAAVSVARAPRDDTERELCALFAEVLGVESVGIEHDFFDLGGNSLLAARLIGRMHGRLGAAPGIRQLFETPTVAELARLLPEFTPVEAAGSAPRPHPLPVSSAQRRLWSLDRLGAGAAYHLPVLVRLDGDLDPEALERAVGEVVARHEVLRTVFDEVDGEPVQRVLPVGAPPFTRVPVRADELEARIAETASRPFDLASEPPFGTVLFTLTDRPGAHVLMLRTHHIALDGWSLAPLLRDLSQAYAGKALPPAPVQYADHALRERLDPGRLEHWRTTLEGLPAGLSLPRRNTAGTPVGTPIGAPADADSGAAATVERLLDAGVHRGLTALAQRQGVTLFMVLHTALGVVLARAGAGEDLPIGTAVAGRTGDADLTDLVGFFVNFLVLRTDLTGDPSLGELLARVRETDLAAFDHQDVPFERVVDAVNPVRLPGRNPFTDVVLVLQNNARPEPDLPGVDARVEVLRPGPARFDLLLEVTDEHGPGRVPTGLTVALEYRTGAFTAETAGWLADTFVTVLRRMAGAAPDTPVGRLAPPHGPEATPAAVPAPREVSPAGPAGRTDLSRRIAAVWAEVLGLDHVDAHADFFALGGNSLTAIRAAARLGREAGLAVTAAQLFTAPTAAALARAIGSGPKDAPIPARPRSTRRTPQAGRQGTTRDTARETTGESS
ncbi:amino acid adenylation domain-containing protein [Streptomyces olivochromogenes]|uniref:amino acid adenylation domain-containing protein n=1 Tax=Streptomyces olivochromogenes TaxID=1963 RepID=UPI001F1CC4FC|nr:amino acid adenylation domain-containing protein [Streptomyces olivochromogenes]MCF3135101.1 amino acid adenylation domain-containing protein [Streptomyces olivochromogenes]